VARGSNTAIFQHLLPDGSIEARYLIIDWGATMGRWAAVGFREKWDCSAYESQNSEFIKSVDDGAIKWGYIGQRTEDATEGITIEDVRWLYRYVGRITDDQLREGLIASGAADDEIECFTKAIRERIDQLKRVIESEQTASDQTR
jgi:hypothetical protein